MLLSKKLSVKKKTILPKLSSKHFLSYLVMSICLVYSAACYISVTFLKQTTNNNLLHQEILPNDPNGLRVTIFFFLIIISIIIIIVALAVATTTTATTFSTTSTITKIKSKRRFKDLIEVTCNCKKYAKNFIFKGSINYQ